MFLQYFDVCYPDGKTAVFGYKDNTENQLYYPLTELSDLWGTPSLTNTTSIMNTTTTKFKINYNGASVEFGYERRPDPVAFYLGGKRNHRKYPVADNYLQIWNERIREIHTVIPKRGTSCRKAQPVAKHYL